MKGTLDKTVTFEYGDGIEGKKAEGVVILQANSSYAKTLRLWSGSRNSIEYETVKYSVSLQAT